MSDLYAKVKARFANISWPESVQSSDKSSYLPSFVEALKQEFKALRAEQRILSPEEMFLVVLHRRIETEFKPTVVSKKTKLKAPKEGAILDVECSEPSCEGKHAVWVKVGETLFMESLQLKCTTCEASLSDEQEVFKKIKKEKNPSAKVSKDKAPKEEVLKKPLKKEFTKYEEMNTTMTAFDVPLSTWNEIDQATYEKVRVWLEKNPTVPELLNS